MKKIRFGSFFSGGFGSPEFALKYENIDFHSVIACEIDKYARESYLNNHQTDNFYHDVIDFAQNREGLKFNDMDLLHFSPPCQEFSKMGNKKGFEGDRGQLSMTPIPIINDIKPKAFIIENVAQLATNPKFKSGFEHILESLKSMGYDVQYYILNSKDYGTPQNRKRVFILGKLHEKIGELKLSKFMLPLQLYLDDEIEDKYYIKQKTKDYILNPDSTYKPHIIKTKDINENTYVRTIVATYWKMARTNTYLEDDRGLRKLTIDECVRLMGDYKELFNKGNLSNSRLYHILGNAIDIVLYRKLIKFLGII